MQFWKCSSGGGSAHYLAEKKIGNQFFDGAWPEYCCHAKLPFYQPSRGRHNCGGDWLIHTAGSQCLMALLPDTDHAVSLMKTETFAMEEVQPHSYTNSSNNRSTTIITMAHRPSQHLHHPRKNHFRQLRRTSSATDSRQDAATGSSSCAAMTAASERTAAEAVERHRRKFLEYWDFG